MCNLHRLLIVISCLIAASLGLIAVSAAAGPPEGASFAGFEPAALYPVGAGPFDVAVGDLNNDGIQDLVTANSVSDTLSVLLGVGDGTFLPQIVVSVDLTGFSDAPRGIALGDLNGDGNLDAAVALAGLNVVTILLGAGDGSLTILGSFNVSPQPVSIALGDVDGDGDLDVVTANQLSANVSVLLNNGDGTLAPQMLFSVGAFPQSVALGDLDGDGDLDMAVAKIASGDVSILFNAGNGTFTQGALLQAATVGGFSVSLADLDNDGDLDVVDALGTAVPSGAFAIFLNRGDGTFLPKMLIEGVGAANSTDVGDINSDGVMDIVVADFLGNAAVVVLGLGNANFGNPLSFNVGQRPRDATFGALDFDGDLDVVSANAGRANVGVLLNLTIAASPADINGDGVVNNADLVTLIVSWGAGAAGSTDLNGDGATDAVDLATLLANWGPVAPVVRLAPKLSSPNVASDPSQSVGDNRAVGEWLAALPRKATLPVVLDTPVRDRAIVDLNSDGWFDEVLLVMGPKDARGTPSPYVLVYVSDGLGGLELAQRIESPHFGGAGGIAVRDLNGDSALDLLIADARGQSLAVMLGHSPNGRFESVPLLIATSDAATVRECLDFLNDFTPAPPVRLRRGATRK